MKVEKCRYTVYFYIIVLCICNFVIGFGVSQKIKNDNLISIDGNKVKVVNVMYTYQKDGEVVEGDYSIVSQQGYEYSTSGSYHKEYENAKISK